jgi:predicted amidohydrolase YtcJ
MKIRTTIVVILAAVLACTADEPSDSPQTADFLYYGGKVYTLADDRPMADAVAVKGERIVYAGTLEGAEEHADGETVRIYLDGMTVIPGLVDAHAHLRSLGRYLSQLKLERARSPSDVRRMVLQAQKSTPPGRWIPGRGWDQNDWKVKKFPTWKDLEGTEANPVYFRRVDGHAAWVNKTALEICGINRDTPNPEGGRIILDVDGEPTGVFIDNAMELISDSIPDPTPAEIDDWMREAIRYCNSLGLVGIHDAGIDEDDLASLNRLHDEGTLTFRVYCMLSTDEEDLAFTEAQVLRGPREEAGGRVVVRAIKLYADGALGSRGAALLAPYSDDTGNTGLLVQTPEKLERLSVLALENGFQVCTHAIGDRGNRVILDVYEKVLHGNEGDPRFRVEHAQVVSLDDIPRFKALGVIPSMQPTHCTSDMYWAHERVGETRVRGAYAWRRFLDDGNRIPCGSDFPVEGANPLWGLYAAVTRQDRQGWPEGGWYPDQRMAIHEAVTGFTIDAAYAGFAENETGTIEAGKLADMTVLDRDPFMVPPLAILNTRVAMTVVGGEIVYKAKTRGQ